MARTTKYSTAEAAVRPVPRFGVFMVTGAVLGIIVAGIVTLAGSYEPSTVLSVVYPPAQVFGFVLLWTVPIGVALAGLVAVALDRVGRRHSRVVRVQHEVVADDDSTP